MFAIEILPAPKPMQPCQNFCVSREIETDHPYGAYMYLYDDGQWKPLAYYFPDKEAAEAALAKNLAENVMEKAGAIPGLIHSIISAFKAGELGETEQIIKYCEAEPKGKALWNVFEESDFGEPYDFIIAHAKTD